MRWPGEWALRALWVLGTAGRALVFAGTEAAALAWSAQDAKRPDSGIGDAIFVVLVTLASQCVIAGLWALSEVVLRIAVRLVIARWVFVVLVTVAVAPIYNQIGEGPTEPLLLLSDFAFGALVFGVLNRTGFDGGSGYWISTRDWSVRFLA